VRKLLESDSLTQVNLLASYLESQGITVRIANEHQGFIRAAIAYHKPIQPELWVRADQFEAAAKLVGRYQYEQESNRSRDGIEWLCGKCKENNPDNFMSCWSCGRAR